MLHDTLLSQSGFTGGLVRSILVVEDEEPIRIFLTEFLQDLGYHVLEAGDVAQARRVLRDVHVDLVFSDINMPGTETGFDLERWLRKHCPDIKVLLTSGFPHSEESTRGLQEPLLAKPYSCSTVMKCIERVLAKPVPVASH